VLVALRLAVRDFSFCLCYETFALLTIRWLLDVGGGPPAPATLRAASYSRWAVSRSAVASPRAKIAWAGISSMARAHSGLARLARCP
jgi:hypothetical protein